MEASACLSDIKRTSRQLPMITTLRYKRISPPEPHPCTHCSLTGGVLVWKLSVH